MPLLVTTSAFGEPPVRQRPGGKPPQAGQNFERDSTGSQDMIVEVTGKLKSLRQGVLVVESDDGTEVLVKPPTQIYKFQFIAEAKAPFLRQGAPVRFQGTFNRQGVAQEPVTKVELFQPVKGKMPGHVRQKFQPGVYPDKREAKQQAETGIAKCEVVGTLVAIDPTGVMMVRAGKVPVRAPLADKVKYEIRYNNLDLAKPGDSIRVAGFYNPPDKTKVVADTVKITTDRVYGDSASTEADGNERRSKRRRKTRKNTRAEDSKSSATDRAEDN